MQFLRPFDRPQGGHYSPTDSWDARTPWGPVNYLILLPLSLQIWLHLSVSFLFIIKLACILNPILSLLTNFAFWVNNFLLSLSHSLILCSNISMRYPHLSWSIDVILQTCGSSREPSMSAASRPASGSWLSYEFISVSI